MDIYSLINSKDIAQYLREIHYEFNSLERRGSFGKTIILHLTKKRRSGTK